MPLNQQPYKIDALVLLDPQSDPNGASYIRIMLDSNPDYPDKMTLDYGGRNEEGAADFLNAAPAARPPAGLTAGELLEFALGQMADATIERRGLGELDSLS